MSIGRRQLVSLAAAAALVVGAVGCTDDDSDEAEPASAAPLVVHVHGLGINPADDALYAATHSGLFRLPEAGRAELVGDGRQDTMGFTVAGPDRFLASGHEGPDDEDHLRADGKPPLLGLVESTDAGETWTPRSLLGEADFHGLAYAHDRAYGWNASSGDFMVSEDLRTWRTLGTVALFSFAVDPDDADHIVGAGPEGLTASDDRGATLTASAGPPMVILSWDADGDLLGIETGGLVHRSGDGSDWQEVGPAPGQPQALLAVDDVLYVAVHDDSGRTSIHVSDDGARSWHLRYRDPEP